MKKIIAIVVLSLLMLTFLASAQPIPRRQLIDEPDMEPVHTDYFEHTNAFISGSGTGYIATIRPYLPFSFVLKRNINFMPNVAFKLITGENSRINVVSRETEESGIGNCVHRGYMTLTGYVCPLSIWLVKHGSSSPYNPSPTEFTIFRMFVRRLSIEVRYY